MFLWIQYDFTLLTDIQLELMASNGQQKSHFLLGGLQLFWPVAYTPNWIK